MESIARSTHLALRPLAAALLAVSLAGPAAAQQAAPGWLNWGGGSSDAESDESRDAEAATARTTPMAGSGASVTDIDAGSGQAALLQRMMQRMDSLESQVRQLQGQVSEHERALERQERRHEEAIKDLEQRVGSAPAAGMMSETGPAGHDAAAAMSGREDGPSSESDGAADAEAGTSDAAAGGQASNEEQQALYNEAFEILKGGEYEKAVGAFQKVIDANPRGSWASSAVFWQGETYYVQRDYDAAKKAYAELLETYPDSNRGPDAMLKLGYIAQEQNDVEEAKRRFNAVIEKHPDSQAAGLAKQRLDRLGG
ncbi:tol-pal system protein YbgF [Guyparkeria sp.]|uniref:tol-pal system protein YbgF n=1 Tax=Guyparkeria sp. TaxID=2035736 RepID=UPI0035640329